MRVPNTLGKPYQSARPFWLIQESRIAHRLSSALLFIAAALLVSCQAPLSQADLANFITTGLTNVLLRSSTFSSGSTVFSYVPSGETITDNIEMVNPTNLAVTYSLSWDVADNTFLTLPSASPTPTNTTSLAVSFELDPATAEHKTIHFTLGKFVASLNKKYTDDTFTLNCDSPPNPAASVAAATDSNQKSIIAITLPTAVSDDDLSQFKITWSEEGSTASTTTTASVASLKTVPSPNPFPSGYDCYFQPSGIIAGSSYAYSVVIVDAVGQESSAVSTSSTANSFKVIYNGNGSDGGTVPATVGYSYHHTASVAGMGNLTKTSYAFSHWNTAADGSGTSYSPGDSLTIPAADTTLYAQWITNQVDLTFDFGTQGLSFGSGTTTINQGNSLSFTTSNSTLTSGGTNWKWYIDGVDQNVSTPHFDWTTTSVGQHIISVSVLYNNISYSGSLIATVTP